MSHAMCNDGHKCQRPSGRVCIEGGCRESAGTLWGPYWCPDHDRMRLDRVSKDLDEVASVFHSSNSSGTGGDHA